EDRKLLAYEELLIAEGSDWCWWYGPEHDSANRPEFDQLFRDHLANVYLALRLPPPEELSRPILRVSVNEFHQTPSGPVRPIIDGEVTSYFEWLGAGIYRVNSRSGAMHGQRFFVSELHYGSDGHHLFLRLDFVEHGLSAVEGTELRINVQTAETSHSFTTALNQKQEGIEAAQGKICELCLPLEAMGIPAGHFVKFQLSLWQGGLPMDALPPQGWIEFSTAEPAEWAI
ncbi:MAG: glycoside hydrolase, partial [Bryobacteraceae bacterium]